jgi:hypothetical protein
MGYNKWISFRPKRHNFTLQYDIRKVQEDMEELELNGANRVFPRVDDLDILGRTKHHK